MTQDAPIAESGHLEWRNFLLFKFLKWQGGCLGGPGLDLFDQVYFNLKFFSAVFLLKIEKKTQTAKVQLSVETS